jgi:hypothetical protein
MFNIETIFQGDTLPTPRNRFVNLPPEWREFKKGSLIADANYEDMTFEFIEWYTESNGETNARCRDGQGFIRHLYGDSIRLSQLKGQGRMRGKRMSLLTEKESKLSRTEKRKLRKERRNAVKAQGID